eukprot:191002_1
MMASLHVKFAIIYLFYLLSETSSCNCNNGFKSCYDVDCGWACMEDGYEMEDIIPLLVCLNFKCCKFTPQCSNPYDKCMNWCSGYEAVSSCKWLYYLNKYADLKAAFGDDVNAAKNHYCQSGINEQRVCKSNCNFQCYLDKYPDLQLAFGNDVNAAENHYYVNGMAEGRDCCESSSANVLPHHFKISAISPNSPNEASHIEITTGVQFLPILLCLFTSCNVLLSIYCLYAKCCKNEVTKQRKGYSKVSHEEDSETCELNVDI